MLGCKDGHWVRGLAHGNDKLPETIVRTQRQLYHCSAMAAQFTHACTLSVPSLCASQSFGVYDEAVYHNIEASTIAINATLATEAECIALVNKDYPAANAASYSNTGEGWCKAVFGAVGVIFDPLVQTCIFVGA